MAGSSEPLTAMVDRALERPNGEADAIRLLASAIVELSSSVQGAVWLARATLLAIFSLIGVIVTVVA